MLLTRRDLSDRLGYLTAANGAIDGDVETIFGDATPEVVSCYFDRLRLDVVDAFEGGTHPNTLAEDFADRYEMSENDARRLARTSICC